VSARKKLIEVSLPLDAINRESAREKTIRHGHPSTFHLWWARRPLATCRAVLFASLVDDPSSHPDQFPSEESQQAERKRLFGIIERMVRWEAIDDATVLSEAQVAISQSCGDVVPTVLDPFCGGGSIPLEAERLGLEVFASDLNPVAVLITRALVEIPPRFAGVPPVHPGGDDLLLKSWIGAQGLAEDIRYYGRWMREQAAQQIGYMYPDVALRGDLGGRRPAIAWLWVRTITCPNPACGTRMPLLGSLALSRRRGREAWLQPLPNRERKVVNFAVRSGSGCPPEGSVGRSGAQCLACGTAVPLAIVRSEALAGRLQSQLVCSVMSGDRRRVYLDADEEQMTAARDVPAPSWRPESDVPLISGIFNTPIYGIDKHWKLFTDRQLVTMSVFCDLVSGAREQMLADGAAEPYANAVATYLGLCIGRLANRSSSQCYWDPGGEGVMQVFARQALPMVWAYAEANPFSDSTGNFLGQVEYLAEALERVPARGAATVRQLDAAAPGAWVDLKVVVCTDPPYYNNVPYADLSDFFYVWLRHCLGHLYPELFSTLLVPKAQELIADPTRNSGSKEKAAEFFESGLRRAFENMFTVHDDAYPLTIFYAFKQAEDAGDGSGHASTGWETMLQGLLDAGAVITGTWPVRTEQPGGLREVGRAALASSIVLVCRPRPASAALGTRREFTTALKAQLPDALHRLQEGNIAPVDLAQAAIGPGMAIFSRFARVVEADGSPMTVRTALGLINQVLGEILAQQEGDFDPETRWAIAWFEECGMDTGPFGKAETLSKAKDTAVNGLVQAGIVYARGNNVRLLSRSELPEAWDPVADQRLTVWEVTQHLIRCLDSGGEAKAADLLRRVGYLGDAARELAYRLYAICERKKWAREALAYNGLIVAWPAIARAGRLQADGYLQQELL
jgi:putative DNA methylase